MKGIFLDFEQGKENDFFLDLIEEDAGWVRNVGLDFRAEDFYGLDIFIVRQDAWNESYDSSFNQFPSCTFILLKSNQDSLPLEFNFDFIFNEGDESSLDYQNIKSLLKLVRNKNENQALSLLLKHSLEQLDKVKRLHEKIVPFRQQKVRGLQWMSKYSAGEAPGGEFFDFIQNDHSITLILTHSTSYMATNFILTEFDKMKGTGSGLDRIKKFISSVESDLKIVDEDEKLDMFLMQIDLKSFECKCYNFGQSRVVVGNELYVTQNSIPISISFLEKSQTNFLLKRGEKLVLLSPGVEKNCQSLSINSNPLSLLGKSIELNARDLLNELFYTFKSKKEGFLNYDASCIVVEVDENAIIAEI